MRGFGRMSKGISSGMQELLDRKYALMERGVDIEQQQANTLGQQQIANAGLLQAQTGLVAPMGRSEIALNAFRAGLLGAQTDIARPLAAAQIADTQANTDRMRVDTSLAPEASITQNLLRRAQTGLLGSQTRTEDEQTKQEKARNEDITSPVFDWLRTGLKSTLSGYVKGTARVPGDGDGTVDDQLRPLASGEAVLNKKAADMLGRGMISALNRLGAAKMGMV